jgi:hypothetical protein
MSPQGRFLLRDYSNAERSHILELPSGRTERGPARPAGDRLRICGLAQQRRLLDGRTLVAFFTAVDKMWLSVSGHLIDMSPPGIHCGKRLVGPLAWRFRVSDGDAELYSCYYLFLALRSWPNEGDIFTWAAEDLCSAVGVKHFEYTWRAVAAGRDIATESFQQELARLLAPLKEE